MKTRNRKHLALLMALIMVFTAVMAPTAFAADVDPAAATVAADGSGSDVEALVEQAEENAAVTGGYYPISGVTSGHFSGLYSSQAVFNLPSGTINISYSFNGGSSAYIRFYQGWGTGGSFIPKGPFLAGNYTGGSSVNLSGGTYTVVVYNPYGSGNSQLIYAYNLY